MRDKAKRRAAGRETGSAVRRLGAGLVSQVSGGWESVVARADREAVRLRDKARELRRSPVLQHALAAHARGNLEAAFWLLSEEFGNRPDDLDLAARYWDVALGLHRIDLAAPAGVALVERHAAASETQLAAQYWTELAQVTPEVLVSPKAIASILPALRKRLDEARPEAAPELRALLRRAMRQAVDPRNQGLSPGVALRLFEEGRDANPEAARRAADVALESPQLHEAKRARLRAWLEGRDPDAERPPRPGRSPRVRSLRRRRPELGRVEALSDAEVAEAAARLPAPIPAEAELDAPGQPGEIEVIEAVPIELADDGLRLDFPQRAGARLDYAEIEAVSVAEIGGLADQPVVVIDLVRNWTRRGEEALRVVRLRCDRFDLEQLAPGACAAGGALAALCGWILERSRAVPLPDPESALGLRVARFESSARYEQESLRAA